MQSYNKLILSMANKLDDNCALLARVGDHDLVVNRNVLMKHVRWDGLPEVRTQHRLSSDNSSAYIDIHFSLFWATSRSELRLTFRKGLGRRRPYVSIHTPCPPVDLTGIAHSEQTRFTGETWTGMSLTMYRVETQQTLDIATCVRRVLAAVIAEERAKDEAAAEKAAAEIEKRPPAAPKAIVPVGFSMTL